jgi:hypothetical protein
MKPEILFAGRPLICWEQFRHKKCAHFETPPPTSFLSAANSILSIMRAARFFSYVRTFDSVVVAYLDTYDFFFQCFFNCLTLGFVPPIEPGFTDPVS